MRGAPVRLQAEARALRGRSTMPAATKVQETRQPRLRRRQRAASASQSAVVTGGHRHASLPHTAHIAAQRFRLTSGPHRCRAAPMLRLRTGTAAVGRHEPRARGGRRQEDENTAHGRWPHPTLTRRPMAAQKQVTVWYEGKPTTVLCFRGVGTPEDSERVVRGAFGLLGSGALLFSPCDPSGPPPAAAPGEEGETAALAPAYVPGAALFSVDVPVSHATLHWRPASRSSDAPTAGGSVEQQVPVGPRKGHPCAAKKESTVSTLGRNVDKQLDKRWTVFMHRAARPHLATDTRLRACPRPAARLGCPGSSASAAGRAAGLLLARFEQTGLTLPGDARAPLRSHEARCGLCTEAVGAPAGRGEGGRGHCGGGGHPQHSRRRRGARVKRSGGAQPAALGVDQRLESEEGGNEVREGCAPGPRA